jgi:hypothetical protein
VCFNDLTGVVQLDLDALEWRDGAATAHSPRDPVSEQRGGGATPLAGHWEWLSVCECLQGAHAVQPCESVSLAHRSAIDHDLRHRGAAGQLPQPGPEIALAAAVDLAVAQFSAWQQRLRPRAVRAPRQRVDVDGAVLCAGVPHPLFDARGDRKGSTNLGRGLGSSKRTRISPRRRGSESTARCGVASAGILLVGLAVKVLEVIAMLNPMAIHHRRCREIRANMSDYLDGDLDAATAAAVKRHVRWCPNCRRMLGNLSRTVAGLRALQADGPPPA